MVAQLALVQLVLVRIQVGLPVGYNRRTGQEQADVPGPALLSRFDPLHYGPQYCGRPVRILPHRVHRRHQAAELTHPRVCVGDLGQGVGEVDDGGDPRGQPGDLGLALAEFPIEQAGVLAGSASPSAPLPTSTATPRPRPGVSSGRSPRPTCGPWTATKAPRPSTPAAASPSPGPTPTPAGPRHTPPWCT